MKTTENTSLAGYAFTMETDAYIELERYLEDIKSCFSNDAGADEIVEDIEERIAELLREKCIEGTVVNLTMVQEVKKRIGNPKELAQEDAAESNFSETQEASSEAEAEPEVKPRKGREARKHRQLYRNMDERILGGVCSGLGTYFGIDKVVFRILLLVFFIVGFIDGPNPFLGFTTLAYICLWIAMPAAVTSEQKREMKGRPTNLENYRSKDFDFGKEVKGIAESPAGKTTMMATGLFTGILLLFFGLGTLLGSIFIPAHPQIIEHSTRGDRLSYADPDERIMYGILTETTFWGIINLKQNFIEL